MDHNPYEAPRAPAKAAGDHSGAAERGWLWLLFGIDGRIGRGAFWAATLGAWGVWFGALFIARLVGEQLVLKVVAIPFLWVLMAVSIKRLHDRGRPTSWVLAPLLPVLGAILWLVECGCLPGQPHDNEYGPAR